MGLAAGARFHQEPVFPTSREGDHVIAVHVGTHLGYRLLGKGVNNGNMRLAVLGIELRRESSLQNGKVHRGRGGVHTVHLQRALPTVPTTGEAGLFSLRIGQVEQLVVRRVHSEVHVLRCAENIKSLVVRAPEHIEAAHAVVALAAEVEVLAIRGHEGEVLVLGGVDIAGEFHGRGEGPVGHQFGAVDVATRIAVLAIAGEVDRATLVRQVHQRNDPALLVETALELFRRHHDLPSDAAEVVEAEEFILVHLHLIEHLDILDVVEQLLPVAALEFKRVHRIYGQGLLVRGSPVPFIGIERSGELIGEVIGAAVVIPGQGGNSGAGDRVLEEAHGLFLVATTMHDAGTQAIVEVMIARGKAHQLGVQGQRLGELLLGEQGISLRTRAATLGHQGQRQEQQDHYPGKTGHSAAPQPSGDRGA